MAEEECRPDPVDYPHPPGGAMGKCGAAPKLWFSAKLWEQMPGTATSPLSGYQRREPEKTVLHQLVAENLETFLRELALEGRTLPRYVEEEFRRYLPCGMVSEGFARVKCRDCGDELIVGFSCKGTRGSARNRRDRRSRRQRRPRCPTPWEGCSQY